MILTKPQENLYINTMHRIWTMLGDTIINSQKEFGIETTPEHIKDIITRDSTVHAYGSLNRRQFQQYKLLTEKQKNYLAERAMEQFTISNIEQTIEQTIHQGL